MIKACGSCSCTRSCRSCGCSPWPRGMCLLLLGKGVLTQVKLASSFPMDCKFYWEDCCPIASSVLHFRGAGRKHWHSLSSGGRRCRGPCSISAAFFRLQRNKLLHCRESIFLQGVKEQLSIGLWKSRGRRGVRPSLLPSKAKASAPDDHVRVSQVWDGASLECVHCEALEIALAGCR